MPKRRNPKLALLDTLRSADPDDKVLRLLAGVADHLVRAAVAGNRDYNVVHYAEVHNAVEDAQTVLDRVFPGWEDYYLRGLRAGRGGNVRARDSRIGTLTQTKAISRDGQVKVEWEETGEGWDGDFDPEDPDDQELLRFYVYRKVGREWRPVNDGSYCTGMPVKTSPAVRKRALVALMNALYTGARNGRVEPGHYEVDGASGFKRRAEGMSWISPADLKEKGS